MAKTSKALVFSMLIMIGFGFLVFAFVEQTSASIVPEKSTICPAGQVAQNETNLGTFQCLTNGTPLGASTCPNPQFSQNFSGSAVVCNTVPVPYLYIVNDSCGLAITNCAGCVSLPCSNGIITAYPTIIGLTRFSGTDCVNVIGNATTQIVSNFPSETAGIFVKAGDYNCVSIKGLNLKGNTLIGENDLGTQTTLDWGTVTKNPANGLVLNFRGLEKIQLRAQLTFNNNNTYIKQNNSNSIINQVNPINSGGISKGLGINLTASNSFIENVFTSLNIPLGIDIFGTKNMLSNIQGSGNPEITDASASASSRNTFSQIFQNSANVVLQLNSGTGSDIITNYIGTFTDNSGQTNNFACPPSGDLPCGRNNVRITSDQTSTANSATSTTLVFSLSASTVYTFTAQIFLTNTATSTANFQIHSLPAGATLIMACATNGAIAITTGNCATATGTNLFGTALSGASSTNIAVTIFGTLTVGATSGNLQLDFLDVAALGTVTVKAGSFMTVNSVA